MRLTFHIAKHNSSYTSKPESRQKNAHNFNELRSRNSGRQSSGALVNLTSSLSYTNRLSSANDYDQVEIPKTNLKTRAKKFFSHSGSNLADLARSRSLSKGSKSRYVELSLVYFIYQ